MEKSTFRELLNGELSKVAPELTVQGSGVYYNNMCVLTQTPIVTEIYQGINGDRKAAQIRMLGEESAARMLDISGGLNQNVIKKLQGIFPQMLALHNTKARRALQIILHLQVWKETLFQIPLRLYVEKIGWFTDQKNRLCYCAGQQVCAFPEDDIVASAALEKYALPEHAQTMTKEQAAWMIQRLVHIQSDVLIMTFLTEIVALIRPLLQQAQVGSCNPVLYLEGESSAGKTTLLRIVTSLYKKTKSGREMFEVPLSSWRNRVFEALQEASGTVVILDDLAGSDELVSRNDAEKLRGLIMTLGNGVLPLRGGTGEEIKVDFLAAVTGNSLPDCSEEVVGRICIVPVKRDSIPIEKTRQIVGSEPSPLAGVYLQMIQYVVANQVKLSSCITELKRKWEQEADMGNNHFWRMNGNYQTYRYAAKVVKMFLCSTGIKEGEAIECDDVMNYAITRRQKNQCKIMKMIEESTSIGRQKETYANRVIRELRANPELLAKSPKEYKERDSTCVGYIDYKNQRVCLKIKRLCKKFPPDDGYMPDGAQERKVARLFLASPWIIRGDKRTTIHGVDDKRFLALKAEAFGLRCEL